MMQPAISAEPVSRRDHSSGVVTSHLIKMWRAIRSHGRPHLVLMDVEMPGENGIELTKALHEKHSDIRVVMLTAFSDSECVFAALT